MESGNKDIKKCFIITPIGNEKDPIRRHIDGIIDAVISPVLEDKNYEVVVAHRITSTGSINKQVITGIYNADLIIANLTNLNPNVMYELAFAHSIGKPTITMAEDGNVKLPFDIATERTIFYKNDFKGVLELKSSLENVIQNIENDPAGRQIDNPIYSWLSSSVYEKTLIKTLETNESGIKPEESDLFRYIINKLDIMESKINNNNINNIKSIKDNRYIDIPIECKGITGEYVLTSIKKALKECIFDIEIPCVFTRGDSLMLRFEYKGISRRDAIEIIKDVVFKTLGDEVKVKLDKQSIVTI